MMNTDPYTVGCLQLRAPTLSSTDFTFIQEHMRSGEGQLFPEVVDTAKRDQITTRLLSTEGIIPSLWTLISDCRYLKHPEKVLRMLLPAIPRKIRKKKWVTIREQLFFHFNEVQSGDGAMEVQTTTSSYRTVRLTKLRPFELAYQQLWLCSYRVSKELNSYGFLELATLASRLGFSTVEIARALKQDPTHDMIQKAVRDVLCVLRPNEPFIFDASQAEPVIVSFKDYLNKTLCAPLTSVSPFITVAGPGEPMNRRCGYSSADTNDLNHLFLDKIHAPLQVYQIGGNEISSFFRQACAAYSFLWGLESEGR